MYVTYMDLYIWMYLCTFHTWNYIYRCIYVRYIHEIIYMGVFMYITYMKLYIWVYLCTLQTWNYIYGCTYVRYIHRIVYIGVYLCTFVNKFKENNEDDSDIYVCAVDRVTFLISNNVFACSYTSTPPYRPHWENLQLDLERQNANTSTKELLTPSSCRKCLH